MRFLLFFIAVLQTITLLVNGAPSLPLPLPLPLMGDQNLDPQVGQGMNPSATATTNTEILIYYKGQQEPDHIQYGQCIPFKKNGQAVRMADFPTLVTCYGYMDADCTSTFPPFPAPFLSQVRYANFLELGSTVWGSYDCYTPENDPFLKKLLPNGSGQKPIV